MKKYLITALCIVSAIHAASAQFITTWKSDNRGSPSTQLTLPISGTDYQIDWWLKSDSAQVNGSEIASGTTTSYTIILPQIGIYGVAISKGTGTINYIRVRNSVDRLKLTEINQWGDNPWTSMEAAFWGGEIVTITATDIPNLTQVNTMSSMFRNCFQIEQVPNIQDWNISNVTDMSYMFFGTSMFNQPLNEWNVTNVINMNSMFCEASKFNQPLNNWDTRNVTNMTAMFAYASEFNQPLNDWNVNNVASIASMFSRAHKFNQPLNKWNVSKVSSMLGIFREAYMFNQSLGEWNLNNISSLSGVLEDSGVDCANITHTLKGWANNPNTPNNLYLEAQGVDYAPQALEALTILRNDKKWSITIGSEVECEALPVSLVYFKAVVKEQIIQLEWATALEENHDFFEVQRSNDTRHWTTLSQLKGAGDTNITQNYYAKDPTPLAGTSYYRLKMLDRDGSFEFSDIRSVNLDKIPTTNFIFPNPAQNVVTFHELPEGVVSIYNTLGQLVKQVYITTEQDTTSISELPTGIYTAKTQQGWKSKLIKIP